MSRYTGSGRSTNFQKLRVFVMTNKCLIAMSWTRHGAWCWNLICPSRSTHVVGLVWWCWVCLLPWHNWFGIQQILHFCSILQFQKRIQTKTRTETTTLRIRTEIEIETAVAAAEIRPRSSSSILTSTSTWITATAAASTRTREARGTRTELGTTPGTEWDPEGTAAAPELEGEWNMFAKGSLFFLVIQTLTLCNAERPQSSSLEPAIKNSEHLMKGVWNFVWRQTAVLVCDHGAVILQNSKLWKGIFVSVMRRKSDKIIQSFLTAERPGILIWKNGEDSSLRCEAQWSYLLGSCWGLMKEWWKIKIQDVIGGEMAFCPDHAPWKDRPETRHWLGVLSISRESDCSETASPIHLALQSVAVSETFAGGVSWRTEHSWTRTAGK